VRARLLATILGCLALAQAGCGDDERTGAAAYTCGHMRDTSGAFRTQARVVVQQAGLRANRLTLEETVLDAEFEIRSVCDGAASDVRPYARAVTLSSPAWVSPASTR
jgi:hypothetical protein